MTDEMPESLPPAIAARVRDRRALLWTCQRYDLVQGEDVHDYDLPPSQAVTRYRRGEPGDAAVAGLYWEAIWLEGAASPLLPALKDAIRAGGPVARQIVILGSDDDAAATVSSREFLPVSVLPGVLDQAVAAPARYGTVRGRIRKRTALALANRLNLYHDRVVVVLGAQTSADLELLFELIEDDPAINPDVLIVWPPDAPDPPLPTGTSATFLLWRGTSADIATALVEAGAPAATDLPRYSIRVGTRGVELQPRDIDRILTRFVVLTEDDIRPATEFTIDDLIAFLNGEPDAWSAYTVGLPVQRSYQTQQKSLADDAMTILSQIHGDPTRRSTYLMVLPTQPGAGATTLLRATALAAARAGFPTLLLRPEQVETDAEEVVAFATTLSEAALAAGIEQMPPILVVLDVEHQQRGITAKGLLGALAAQGRAAVLLQAVPELGEAEVERRDRRSTRLPVLRSILSDAEVERCSRAVSEVVERWNLPMAVPSIEDWHAYERATRWLSLEDESGSSLFWVALRFFLTQGMSFSDAAQAQALLARWITERTDIVDDPSIQKVITYVAAMSSFRLPSPLWTVLRPALDGVYSASLSQAIKNLDGIVVWDGQVRGLEGDALRFIHPTVAEAYLAHHVAARSSEERMRLLSPVLAALSPGSPADIWVAESLAKNVLTPTFEERSSAQWDWRLDTFELVPPAVREQSKTLLHHWARSLYLSADQRPPRVSFEERLRRYGLAIEKLQRAIGSPRRSGRDEYPSHLYNTLGTAFHRLYSALTEADRLGDASEAWSQAYTAFEKSVDLSGGVNLESLLGFSQRLVAHANESEESNRNSVAEDALYALQLLDDAEDVAEYQAAPDPDVHHQIAELRASGLRLLDQRLGDEYLEQLIHSAQPELGYYCKARLTLQTGWTKESIDSALAILREAEERGVNLGPGSISLRISLLEHKPIEARDFSTLRELYKWLEDSEPNRVRPLHLFRHAVLCYQTGAFSEGAERFRRLRAQFRSEDVATIRLQDIWRDPDRHDLPRLTPMRVDHRITEWRAQGYLLELHQSVPFRPRHFVPPPSKGDVITCAIRFESNGPLAVPPRFVSSHTTTSRSNQPGTA